MLSTQTIRTHKKGAFDAISPPRTPGNDPIPGQGTVTNVEAAVVWNTRKGGSSKDLPGF